MIGAPALMTSARPLQSGPPLPGNTAFNGLSVDPVFGRVVLGQDVGQVGAPATLASTREIPLAGFNVLLSGIGMFIVQQTPAAFTSEGIQVDTGIRVQNGFGGNIRLQPNPVSTLLIQNASAAVRLEGPNNFTEYRAQDVVTQMTNTGLYDVQTAGNVSRLRVLQNGNVLLNTVVDNGISLQVNGGIRQNDATTLLYCGSAMANGAAAAAGTLNNAPAAGNPTKWLPVNDAGTIRYIPSW